MRLLLVFLKEPTPGKVKPRLAADVGDDTAARYYRALVEVLLKQLQGLQNTRIRFCYAPDDAHDAIRFWLLPQMKATGSGEQSVFLAPATPTSLQPTQEIDFRAQGDGHWGDRMHRAFSQGFSDGFQQIAAIGTDCPECGSRWINAAFARIQTKPNNHGVIGPCPNGGYYFLALQSLAPAIFDAIPWNSQSQNNALSATLKAAKNSQLTLEQLPPLNDVDYLDDWHRLLNSPLGPSIKKSLGKDDL
jgi:glycosyltransferase A (GT-A) superfamily protein (DUF2064 family)